MFEKLQGMIPKAREKPQKDVKYQEEIIDFIKSQFIRRQSERTLLELKWRLNINFAKGNQFMQINTHAKDVQEQEQFAWYEEREIFNQIQPTLETRLAKLTKLKNNLKTRPATGEEKDIASAKICNKLLPATKKRQNMSRLRKRANTWAELTGTAIWKTVWNPSKGRLIGQMAQGTEITENEDNSLEDFERKIIKESNKPVIKNIYEGDIQTTVHSPFEIYPDSIWNNPEDCRSIIHAKVYDINDVYEIWGIDVKGKQNNVFTINSTKGAGTGSIGQKGFGFTIGTATKNNSVMVYEYWELPTRRYPNGRLIIVTDNELLYYGELPDQLGDNAGEYKLPFVVQKCLPTEEGYFGDCLITRLIPLQRRYNSIKNRKKEYLNRATIGVVTAEEGALDLDLYEKEGIAPGDIVEFKRGFQPPRFMDFHALPMTFETEEKSIEENINRLSGVSELSKQSVTPAGIDSGIAIASLAEQDATRIGLTADIINDTDIEIAKNWLKLYKNNIDFPRMVRHVGENNEVEIIKFQGNDITTFDVFIETISELSESPAQRKAFIFQLLNTGLFNDPDTGVITREGRIKIFEMLEMGDFENFDNDDQLHVEKADRENQYILQGKPPIIRDFDDDLIHIKKHNNFRLTSDYEDMAMEVPQIDMLFEQHLMEHYQSLQAKAQASAPPPEEEIQ